MQDFYRLALLDSQLLGLLYMTLEQCNDTLFGRSDLCIVIFKLLASIMQLLHNARHLHAQHIVLSGSSKVAHSDDSACIHCQLLLR